MNRKKYNLVWLIMIAVCILALVFSAIFAGATVNFTKVQKSSDSDSKKDTAPTYYYEENTSEISCALINNSVI